MLNADKMSPKECKKWLKENRTDKKPQEWDNMPDEEARQAVKDSPQSKYDFSAVLLRDPLTNKRDEKRYNWQDTAHAWLVTINGKSFEYFTGSAHRIAAGTCGDSKEEFERLKNKNLTESGFKSLLACSKAKPPTVDSVLFCFVMDSNACEMSFNDWCSDYGYDTDSRKALETYLACQENTAKLRKAGINIEAERERLADY